jgi:deoxyribonuclease-4
MKLGYHVSIKGALDLAVDRAYESGCKTFQIFTCSPRQWRASELKEQVIINFLRKIKEYGFEEIAVHMPYLPNLSSPSSSEIYTKSIDALRMQLRRCRQLRIPYLVTHFGSHMGLGVEGGHKQFVAACNSALEEEGDSDVTLLLENTAGIKEDSLGSSFENIKSVMDQIKQRDRIGVCLDSCHLFAAGYDIRDKATVDRTLKRFDEIVGYEHLKLIHLNDSRGDFGKGVDRHEHIGLGKIGKKGMKCFLGHSMVRKVPVILETPSDSIRNEKDDLKEAIKLASSSSSE